MSTKGNKSSQHVEALASPKPREDAELALSMEFALGFSWVNNN